MALSVDKLILARDDLIVARARGIRTLVDQNGERIEYKSDGEMRSAIAALDRLIAELAGRMTPRTIYFSTSKGID